MKTPYICGPLTELKLERQQEIKAFYSAIADICQKTLGMRAFVPHEHYDPVKFAHFEDIDVFDAESKQIIEKTSFLFVVCEEPSWGGGAEIALAGEHGIPITFLVPTGKKISRYITGLVKRKLICHQITPYNNFQHALNWLEISLPFSAFAPRKERQ